MREARFVYADWPFRLPLLNRFSGWTPGPFSYIAKACKTGHRDLHVHEATHQAQFWRGPLRYVLGYLFVRGTRFELEVEAFAAQMTASGRTDAVAVERCAQALYHGYRTGRTLRECRDALTVAVSTRQ